MGQGMRRTTTQRGMMYDDRMVGGERRRGAMDGSGGDSSDDEDEGGGGGGLGQQRNRFMRYSSSSHAVVQGGSGQGMARSQSHPKLSSLVDGGGSGSGCGVAKDVIATRGGLASGPNGMMMAKKRKRIPKRLKIVNFWARTRFFQRCFMVWMIVWISMIIYNSGVIESYLDIRTDTNSSNDNNNNNTSIRGAAMDHQRQQQQETRPTHNTPTTTTPAQSSSLESNTAQASEEQKQQQQQQIPTSSSGGDNTPQSGLYAAEGDLNHTESLLLGLKFPADYETRDALSPFHWSAILKRYNVSLTAKYISILPSIRVAHLLSPADVLKLRNPNEKSQRHNFQWKALAAALDPIDFSDVDAGGGASGGGLTNGGLPVHPRKDLHHQYPYGTPLYPKSPMELFFAAILVCISVFVLTYTLIVMYRCICTRNYAEWRASWTDQTVMAEDVGSSSRKSVHNVLQNSVPISIRGHHHSPIECLASDGALVASSCLEGRINVWDVTSGIRVSSIQRGEGEAQTQSQERRRGKGHQIWCLDFVDNLVAVGCADGRLEFWEGSTGNAKVSYKELPYVKKYWREKTESIATVNCD